MPLLQPQHVTYKLLSPQRNIQTIYVAHMSPTVTVTWYVVVAMATRFPLQQNATMVCCCLKKYVYQI